MVTMTEANSPSFSKMGVAFTSVNDLPPVRHLQDDLFGAHGFAGAERL